MSEVRVTKPEVTKAGIPALRYEPFFTTFPFGGSLFGASPFRLMRRLTEEMDRAFGKFAPTVAEHEFWAPTLELTQANGNLVAKLEIPGLKKEEVKVEITDEGLIVTGERKLEKEEKEEGYFRSERTYGKFYRMIPLPEGVKAENTKAELNNGVLVVTVPVPETKTNVKQVPVVEGKMK